MYCLPEDTARVARAFPKGNAYLRVYDALGPIHGNPQFAALFPKDGQPGGRPGATRLGDDLPVRGEGWSDRRAADAVRGRIDWKYALCLELEHPAFDASVLSEFRTRPHRCGCRDGAVRDAADDAQGGGPGRATGPSAHRFDACAGGDSGAQPARTGRRDPARPRADHRSPCGSTGCAPRFPQTGIRAIAAASRNIACRTR